MTSRLRTIFAAWITSFLTVTHLAADDLPQLRLTVLKIGTVNWELETIKRLGLDTQNGFGLIV